MVEIYVFQIKLKSVSNLFSRHDIILDIEAYCHNPT